MAFIEIQNFSDKELTELSFSQKLSLNLIEMKKIKAYVSGYDRGKNSGKITIIELQAIAQTWSEHCKHKIFNANIEVDGEIHNLFDDYIKNPTEKLQRELEWVKSTLSDNGGVIDFNKKYYLAIKGETHNSPSNINPVYGAETGILGVFRDIMGTGLGARPVFSTFGFYIGPSLYRGKLNPNIHPINMLEGITKGIESGGNKSGVPTIFGQVYYHEGYIGKPGVFVFAGGLMPSKIMGIESYKKSVESGDKIIMIGGKVGRDGIHGSTQSSQEFSENINKSHTQVGNPFLQINVTDFLDEAKTMGLYKSITDNGAGGLSSSVGEMGSDTGAIINLETVPLKEYMEPWEILISESQERMTLAATTENTEKLIELGEKHGIEVAVIGEFNNSREFQATYNGDSVMRIDMEFLHKGVPTMNLKGKWQSPISRGLYEPEVIYDAELETIISRENICSTEVINRQFDHEVQGTSVIKPFVGKYSDVPSDASVIKPDFKSQEGIAVTVSCNPSYGDIDTYHMTAVTIDETIRRLISVGANLDRIALNDNFAWPSVIPHEDNPDAEYKTAQLVRAAQALRDCALGFKTPFVSGKDSMSMDGYVETSEGKVRVSAPPTLQISGVGIVEDIEKCVTMDVKNPEDIVYILGETKNELGGSEFYRSINETGLNVPTVDIEKNLSLYRRVHSAIDKGYVSSISGCYRGGMMVSALKKCFGGDYGMEIDISGMLEDGMKQHQVLHSESSGRFLVTISPEDKQEFEETLSGNYFELGYVRSDKQFIVHGEKEIREDINHLKSKWKFGDYNGS